MAFTVFVIILVVVSYNIYKFISERKKQAILAKEKWYREEAERKREQEKYEREQKISARLRNEKLKKEETEKESARESTKRREEFLSFQKEKFKNAVESIPKFEIILSDKKHNRNLAIDVADKQYKNITKSTPVSKLKDFVVFDTETTGIKVSGNDIIQLSAIKYRNFYPVQAFDTYVCPRNHIPKEASDVNGITDDMVKDAPKFYQIIDSFNEFIEDLPLVAHNAEFDVKHIYANGLDSVADKTVYDTLALSRRIMKDEYSYKLGNICESAGIYIANAHNSLYDCYATGELFKYLIGERKEISIDDLIGKDEDENKEEQEETANI